jgi:hypothetical protein
MEIIDIFDAGRNGADLAPLGKNLLSLLPLGACSGYLLEQAGMNFGSEAAHDTQQTV